VLGLALAATAIVPGRELMKNLRLGDAEPQPDHMPIRFEVAGNRGHERLGRHVAVAEAELLARAQELGVRTVSCSWGDYWGNCRVYPDTQFQSERDWEGFKKDLTAALPDQAGVVYRLGEERNNWRENSDRNVVEFALRGEDMAQLMVLSNAVAEHLGGSLTMGDPMDPQPGTVDLITTPYTEGGVELHVMLDDERLRPMGLLPDDVATEVGLAFEGVALGRIRGEHGELALRLSARPVEDASGVGGVGAGLDALRELAVPLPDGRTVPLGSIAEVELQRHPFWVQRVDRQTEVRIQVRFFDTDQKANWNLVSAAMEGYQFPPGYSWGRGTLWRKQGEANARMLVDLGLCLLLVYAVMASLFESFLQPLGILVCCLLGCVGAPWALWLTGTTLDTTAVIGFFLLIGVVVNNGIMLVDRVIQLRRGGMSRDEALAAAGRDRLRPILMTVLTTVLGLVPMLIHHPALAGVYYHAIAIVLAGGLATSTVITLIFLPATYVLIEDLTLSTRRVWRRFAPRSPDRRTPS
jgi:multidrug efflux pump subunit AcrB